MKGVRGRGTLEQEKPPILGLIQGGGEVVMRMLENVQQRTIEPVIRATVAVGSQCYTDEYDIYARLPSWGYEHRTVCHGHGEYARDDDGDGFHEMHVNTIVRSVVITAVLVAPPSGRLPGELATVSGVFRVCPQCPCAR